MQGFGSKKILQLLGIKINAATSQNEKIMQPVGTKKSRNLGTKKIMQLLGTKKVMQPLGTNHATSQDKKK